MGISTLLPMVNNMIGSSAKMKELFHAIYTD